MKKLVLVTSLVVFVYGKHHDSSNLEVVLPKFFDIINNITNTTMGMVRGGISVLNATVSNLMNSALTITDRIRGSLEEFRKYMITGIPELGLPILDPLQIERIDINISHEALTLKGYVEDVTVRYLSKFRLDYVNFRVPEHLLDLNITFPLLDIKGYYDIKGDVGQLFAFFGKGRFRLRLYDFSLGTISRISFAETVYPPVRVVALRVTPKLRKLENNFEGLMNNTELEETFNKAITKLAPNALDTLWPEIEPEVTRMITTIAFILSELSEAQLKVLNINRNQSAENHKSEASRPHSWTCAGKSSGYI